MKVEKKHDRKIERKIDNVFYKRDMQSKSFEVNKRIPKQEHFVASSKK